MMKLSRKQSTYDTYKDYMSRREQYFSEEKSQIYSSITFDEDEYKADSIWEKMLQADRLDRKHTFYHTYTLRHREQYEKTNIFKVIRNMPKGATHHIHVDCCTDFDWFYDTMAFQGTCYLNKDTKMFHYFADSSHVKEGFINLINIRQNIGDEECRKLVKSIISVTQEEAENFEVDIWQIFEEKILSLSNFYYNSTIYPQYIKHVFKQFINDGVYRLEARCFMGWLLDENLNPVDLDSEMKIYLDAIQEAKQECPEFSFAVIIQGLKVWDKEEMLSYYEKAYTLRAKYPDLIKAFDMVQEEDAFKSLQHIAEVMIKQAEFEIKYQIDFPFIFHAGESIDNQLNTNMYDAIRLHSKRVGHGINLIQHSNLFEEIKKRQICLENCPLSNQVLRYVNDVRLHPLRSFINANIPVSISPDDPGIFGCVGVSQDFYVSAIGQRLNLRDLKLLINNSIVHSLADDNDLKNLRDITERKWKQFIQWFLDSFNNNDHLNQLDAIIGNNPPKRFM